jgi:ferritin-like metal-binding protein YciE
MRLLSNVTRNVPRMTLNRLTDLFAAQLKELYDAERKHANILPKLEDAAGDLPLQSAFREHLRETEQHLRRLDEISRTMGLTLDGGSCVAMKGLLTACGEAIGAGGNPYLKDAALITAAQRVEHFEIASYRSIRTLARCLGRQEIVRLLQQTLDEEAACDHKLTRIAETSAIVASSRW